MIRQALIKSLLIIIHHWANIFFSHLWILEPDMLCHHELKERPDFIIIPILKSNEASVFSWSLEEIKIGADGLWRVEVYPILELWVIYHPGLTTEQNILLKLESIYLQIWEIFALDVQRCVSRVVLVDWRDGWRDEHRNWNICKICANWITELCSMDMSTSSQNHLILVFVNNLGKSFCVVWMPKHFIETHEIVQAWKHMEWE